MKIWRGHNGWAAAGLGLSLLLVGLEASHPARSSGKGGWLSWIRPPDLPRDIPADIPWGPHGINNKESALLQTLYLSHIIFRFRKDNPYLARLKLAPKARETFPIYAASGLPVGAKSQALRVVDVS